MPFAYINVHSNDQPLIKIKSPNLCCLRVESGVSTSTIFFEQNNNKKSRLKYSKLSKNTPKRSEAIPGIIIQSFLLIWKTFQNMLVIIYFELIFTFFILL